MSLVRYESARPCARLNLCVARFWQVESDASLVQSPGRWSLPDGGSEWVFVLADPMVRGSLVHRAGAYVAGTALTAYRSRHVGRMLTFGVAFEPAGAAAVLHVPASDLTGRAVPLEHVWGLTGRNLADRLAEAQGFLARVQLVQRELLARLRPPEAEVADAVLRLAGDPGMAVGVLAGDAASARRLERKFLAQIGVGPKRLARVFRLQRAVQIWVAGGADSWADLAAVAGYSDQSHMVREFRELAGATPPRAFERERGMSDSFNTGAR